MNDVAQLLPLVAIAVLFWLLVIRPAGKRARELHTLQSSLEAGDDVLLTSGVFGTVQQVEEGHLVVEVAEGVVLKVVRGAVGSVIPPEQHEDVDSEVGDESSSNSAVSEDN